MSIRKPMGLGLLVVLALAFAALPAMASAVTLDNAAGTALVKGATVTGTSSNLVFTSASGVALKCSENNLTGKVTTNPTVTFEKATFTGPSGGPCATNVPGLTATVTADPNPPDWTLSLGASDAFTLGSPIAFTVVFNSTPQLTCTFSRSSVTGTFTTNVVPATFTVGASQTFTKSAASSAECGATGTLSGSFTTPGVKVTP
jgi:hypothetical protein